MSLLNGFWNNLQNLRNESISELITEFWIDHWMMLLLSGFKQSLFIGEKRKQIYVYLKDVLPVPTLVQDMSRIFSIFQTKSCEWMIGHGIDHKI